ncbi:hypothetical protein HDV01_000612 [Terramyces sp. JEL0728]|nr:hypothetical protein HDV01_000612 [Terramyces sp. JEL0728]
MQCVNCIYFTLTNPDPEEIPKATDKPKVCANFLEKVKIQNVILNLQQPAIDDDAAAILHQQNERKRKTEEYQKAKSLRYLAEKVKRNTLQLQVDEMYRHE